MGIFRRKDERAIPKPGTPEFDQVVQGSALPDSKSGQSVSMGESGWTEPAEPAPKQRDEVEAASEDPRAPGALLKILLGRVPNSDGFGGGVPGPKGRSSKGGDE